MRFFGTFLTLLHLSDFLLIADYDNDTGMLVGKLFRAVDKQSSGSLELRNQRLLNVEGDRDNSSGSICPNS